MIKSKSNITINLQIMINKILSYINRFAVYIMIANFDAL